jgi:GNAT superfamily N-acetyltransferase
MATTNLIRTPVTGEVEQIKKLAIDTNMFGIEEVGFFDETLAGFFDGSLEDNYWLVVEGTDGQVMAAAYFAPEPFSDRMWNLYFISVAPEHQGQGLGVSPMEAAEEQLRSSGEDVARVLIVETSSTDQYARPGRSTESLATTKRLGSGSSMDHLTTRWCSGNHWRLPHRRSRYF